MCVRIGAQPHLQGCSLGRKLSTVMFLSFIHKHKRIYLITYFALLFKIKCLFNRSIKSKKKKKSKANPVPGHGGP
jgi:hypothetical protein